MKKFKHPKLDRVQEGVKDDKYLIRHGDYITILSEQELLALGFVEVEETTKLPMKWEELGTVNGYFIIDGSSRAYPGPLNVEKYNKNVRPTKELAEASLALSQLMQLRDAWREGAIDNNYYAFIDMGNDIRSIDMCSLSFETQKKRDLFQETFADLIETALPLFYS